MSSLNNNNSFIKRKPVPVASEQDYGDPSLSSQTSKTDKPTDPSFLNQAPKAPAKSPLRHSNSAGSLVGNQNASTTPISSSTQTTIVQPVKSTMTITSAPTISTQNASNSSIISKNSITRSRPSVDTASINSSISLERDLPSLPENENENEYEGSVKSNQTYNSKLRSSEQSFYTTNSPTSTGFPITSDINTNNTTSTTKVKLSSLAIAKDLIASSEAMLSLGTPKLPGSSFLDTADEMLMQILISQAVIDSKDFEILSLEEVEELKKDHSLLTTRIAALTSKLSLESKIREAASSLARLHASNKRLSRQATDHLATANRKVDQVATELWKLTQRAGEVQRKLLQHMAGVLSLGIRKLEEKSSQNPPFSPQNLPQPQVTEDNNKIEKLFNELLGTNNDGDNNVSDIALLEKVSNLENALQSVHQTLAEARMALKRKDKEIEELRAKVDDTAAEVRERTIAELRTELEEIGSRLDIVLRKHKANNRENNVGSGSDNEDSDESSNFYRLSTMTTATQHLQKEQYKNIEENLSALEKALEDYMFKIYKMEQEISSVKNESDNEIKTLQNQLQEAINDMNKSQEALKTEKTKNSDAESEINELKEKVKLVQDLEQQIKDMEKRQTEKGIDEKNFNTNLELKLKQMTREYEEMMDHLKNLFNILPDTDSNDDQNKDGYNNTNKNKFGVDEFINRVRAVGEENRRLHDQTSLLQSRLERIHEQMIELKGKDNIKQELRDTQQELEETKAKLADLEEKAQSAKSQVQSTNERENEMRNELESLREQLTTSKEKVRKFEAIMKRQSVLQVVNDGTSIKEEFQQQLAAQEQEYEAQLKERDIVITKLRNDLTSTTSEKDKVSQTVKDLEEMLKSKSRTLDQREVTINRLESDIVKYKSELTILKAAADGEGTRFNSEGNNEKNGKNLDNDSNKLKEELEAAHEELKHLRNVKEKLEAQLRQSKDTLEKAQAAFSMRESSLEKRSESMQAELDGILKEFDRLTRNFLDFDSERQKLENQLDNLQKKCENLENELADEKLKNMGMDAVNEPATTATLRKEFRKMMADLRVEQQKLLHRETEEKKKLENTVRNLKREKEAEKWERANKGTQTGFVVSVLSG